MLVLAIGIFLYLGFDKPELILKVNSNFSPTLDILFTYLTLLGEAPIVILTLLFVLIKDKQNFWQIAIAFSFMAILMYLFKFHIFEEILRPRAFINNDKLLHFIEGVEMHLRHSFPSGHTTTAFLSFFILSSYSKNYLVKLICLLFAMAVGYSRMYLGQHFFEDVLVGSSLGVFIGILALRFKINFRKRSL